MPWPSWDLTQHSQTTHLRVDHFDVHLVDVVHPWDTKLELFMDLGVATFKASPMKSYENMLPFLRGIGRLRPILPFSASFLSAKERFQAGKTSRRFHFLAAGCLAKRVMDKEVDLERA